MFLHGLHKKIVLLLLFWMTVTSAKDAIGRYENTQVQGGTYQPGYKSEAACKLACKSSPSCWSLDFNDVAKSCWFHNHASGCSSRRPSQDVVHVSFVTCHDGVHAIGGTRQSTIRDLATCVARCTGTCRALDFDTTDNSCWYHTQQSSCSQLLSQSNTNHYKVSSCGTAQSSVSQVQSYLSSNVAPQQNSQAPSGTQNDQAIHIIVKETHAQMHAFGGTMFSRRVSWVDCVRACAESVSCKAVDHVSGINTCWMHTAATACGQLSVCKHCKHYKLATCGRVEIETSTCGRPAISPIAGRVLGGTEAIRNSWSFQLALRYYKNPVVRCGATLIAWDWVLTTAHCVDEDTQGGHWELSAAAHDLRKYEYNREYRKATKVILHPNFDQTTFDYDVALLKLERPFSRSPKVSPVCLPSQSESVLPGTLCAVIGWGKPSQSSRTLHQAFVPIVGQSTCRRREWLGGQFLITDRMLCAGYENGQVDSCQGDSGGPLVCYQGNRWVQHGITSFGRGCGLPRKPGVYARTSSFSNWIQNTMNNN